jgi:hypothetical protein
VLEEQLLDPHFHDRRAFTSGVSALDEYLRHFAFQQTKKGIAVVRVLVDTNTPKDILGYYSLSAAPIDADQMDGRTQQKLPRYPVPCFRLGRLAVHSVHHGRGWGGSSWGAQWSVVWRRRNMWRPTLWSSMQREKTPSLSTNITDLTLAATTR